MKISGFAELPADTHLSVDVDGLTGELLGARLIICGTVFDLRDAYQRDLRLQSHLQDQARAVAEECFESEADWCANSLHEGAA